MSKHTQDYRNRITGLEYVKAGDLESHPGNWRQHNKNQVDALLGILGEVGISGALLAYRSERNGGKLTVIDGHLRKDAAPQVWPVLVLDVDDAEADYLLAVVDPLAAMATADAAALDALLSSVNSGDKAVQEMLAELAEQAGLYVGGKDVDAEPQINRADELREKWGVVSGQLWGMADHRLICGDCTDKATVERVMGGEKAAMVWADPPFGIEYTGHGASVDGRANKFAPITGDDRPSGDWLPLFVPVSGGAIYLKTTWAVLHEWESILGSLADLKARIVWDKCSHVAGDVLGGYATQSEIVLFATVGRHKTNKFDTDVWRIARATTGSPQQRTGHPYESPVELPARAIENSSQAGDIVADPFAGSGTTGVACHNLGRKARMIEIDPGYCGVILERMSGLGMTPVLLEHPMSSETPHVVP